MHINDCELIAKEILTKFDGYSLNDIKKISEAMIYISMQLPINTKPLCVQNTDLVES